MGRSHEYAMESANSAEKSRSRHSFSGKPDVVHSLSPERLTASTRSVDYLLIIDWFGSTGNEHVDVLCAKDFFPFRAPLWQPI